MMKLELEQTLYTSTLLYILVPLCKDLETQLASRYGRQFMFAQDLKDHLKKLPTADFADELLALINRRPGMYQRVDTILDGVISVEQFVMDMFEAMDPALYPFQLCKTLVTESNVLSVLNKHEFFQCLDRRKAVAVSSAAVADVPPEEPEEPEEPEPVIITKPATPEPLQFELEMSDSEDDYFTHYMSLWVKLNPPPAPQFAAGISA